MFRYILIILLAFTAEPAFAIDGISFSASLMGLTNGTEQGGQGTRGSTLLSQTELVAHYRWFSVGAFTQVDKQGENQTDVAAGAKIELNLDPLYLEYGHAFTMKQNFNDRSIAEQSGDAWSAGVGARFFLGATPSLTFVQVSYRMRQQKILRQDSLKIDEPIIQTDGYPLFGIGLLFGGGSSASGGASK